MTVAKTNCPLTGEIKLSRTRLLAEVSRWLAGGYRGREGQTEARTDMYLICKYNTNADQLTLELSGSVGVNWSVPMLVTFELTEERKQPRTSKVSGTCQVNSLPKQTGL